MNDLLKPGTPIAHVTDLLNKLAGPAFEEAGAILGDKLRVYRVRNAVRTVEKTKRILQAANLEPNLVPSRLLLPIIETCSVEDNPDLQEWWAGLLASASQQADSLSPSFIETLKQLTPAEAKFFDTIFDTYIQTGNLYDLLQAPTAPKGASETYERLGLIYRVYGAEMEAPNVNLFYNPEDGPTNEPSTLTDLENAFEDLKVEVQYLLHLTKYAHQFMRACRGPEKAIVPD